MVTDLDHDLLDLVVIIGHGGFVQRIEPHVDHDGLSDLLFGLVDPDDGVHPQVLKVQRPPRNLMTSAIAIVIPDARAPTRRLREEHRHLKGLAMFLAVPRYDRLYS